VLYFAWRERDAYRPFRRSNLSWRLTGDLVKLSLPAAFATIAMMLGFGVFTSFAGKLDAMGSRMVHSVCGGLEAVNGAATTNIVELMKLTFTACLAFGTATATLVAQSLGIKRDDLATKFGWASVKLGFVIFGVVGVAEGLLFTHPIVHFLTHSHLVAEAMITPLRVMGVVTPLVAVAMILSEALFGAGATKFVAMAQFVLVFFALVPLAWLLSLKLDFGLVGMWLAAAVYAILASVTMSLKFRSGTWKSIRI
jgi:Na+-driven multidrug efflux pump